jgi:DNA-binding NarL/FixJ family response regulator
MSENVRIVVTDDHPIFRQGVVHALKAEPDFDVVGEADCGTAALAMAQRLLPDVVLLDISMPGWSGLTTAERIAAACPSTSIIMLTSSEDKDMLLEAFKAGAKAYVLKGVSGQDLSHVIRSVADGSAYVPPSLAAHMLISSQSGSDVVPLQGLNARETQILSMIGAGMTNREIGGALGLAEKTIKSAVTGILQKLRVRNRVEAALMAPRRSGDKAKPLDAEGG